MSRSPELMDKSMKCPLCMELLGMDDVNFFPCTCGYQICCFCWHRIRTDENGLCPACETTYPEDPAAYKPVSPEELQWIKYEKKQKQIERKQQMKEYRKHLGSVRVVQRNLVFVVGLSHRLADPAVLKSPEYFGKFGKIHKVVVQKGTSHAGPQGSGACAYVTYIRSEDALQAIQCLNNVVVDGRSLKTSLGMTKYCSYFLESMQCPKPDCMYQHKLVNEAASFTKEAMQSLKHQEYEQKLLQEPFNMNPSLLQSSAAGETKSKSGSSQSPRDSISVGNGDNLQQLAGDGSISRHGSGAGDGSMSRRGAGAGDGSMSRRGAGAGDGSMSRRGAGAGDGSMSRRGAGAGDGSMSRRGAGPVDGSMSRRGSGAKR